MNARQYICFIGEFREMIAAAAVDPANTSANEHRRGLRRIANTGDEVPFVTMCNLANLEAALRGWPARHDQVRLLAVRAGQTWTLPTRRHSSWFEPMIEAARADAAMTIRSEYCAGVERSGLFDGVDWRRR